MRLHTLMDRCVVMYLQYGGAISHQPAVLHQHSHAEIHIRGGDTRALVTVTDVGHTSNLRLQKCDVKKGRRSLLYSYTIPLHSISLTSKHPATALVFVWTCKVSVKCIALLIKFISLHNDIIHTVHRGG